MTKQDVFFGPHIPASWSEKTQRRSDLYYWRYVWIHMDPYGLNFRATFQGICPKFSQEYGFIIFCWRFLYLPVSNLQNYWVSQGLQCLPRLPRVQGFLVRLLRGAEGGDGWWDLDVATKAAEQWPNGTGFGMVCLNIYIYTVYYIYIYYLYIDQNGGYTLTWPLNGLTFAKRQEGKSRETGI